MDQEGEEPAEFTYNGLNIEEEVVSVTVDEDAAMHKQLPQQKLMEQMERRKMMTRCGLFEQLERTSFRLVLQIFDQVRRKPWNRGPIRRFFGHEFQVFVNKNAAKASDEKPLSRMPLATKP
jgi:hypothetical protein